MKGDIRGLAGAVVVIAASGPSQRAEDLHLARCGGAEVIAINETWRLAPWAGWLYGYDPDWWRLRGPARAAFHGVRIVGAGPAEGCALQQVQRGAGLVWDAGALGDGGSSAFQAVNLAAAAGARRIVLTGVDCRAPADHWHGLHAAPLRRASHAAARRWIAAFDAAAPELAARGIEVVNATRETALQCFPRADITEAVAT